MALRRSTVKDPTPVEPETPAPYRSRSMVAAAAQVKLDTMNAGAMSFALRDAEWINEGWRHYDICGELRFAANRHAAALSQVRMFVAEVDELGRPGDEAKDPQVQILAETIFGGPPAKAEAIRKIGIQEYIAGECYIVAEGANNTSSDTWYVVSAKELKKLGGVVKVKRPMNVGGGWHDINTQSDILLRMWTPHPRLNDVADSPTRSVLPILREIEQLSKLAFSQIDSRLISAGLLLFKEGVTFPAAEGKVGGVNDLLDMLLDAGSKQLMGAGTAAGLLPLMATVPTGPDERRSVADAVTHIKFDSPLQAEIGTKLDQAIRRLATGLDIAPEDLLGQGDSNHWAAWQIAESSIQLFIVPVMTRICAGLAEAYLQPALKVLGLDPTKYTLWFDTSPLTVRPNRMEDAMNLYDRGELSGEALRTAGSFDAGDHGNAKAQLVWMTWQLVKADPALISDPVLAKILGFPEGVGVPQGPPPPPPDQTIEPPPEQNALPQMPSGSTPAQGDSGQAPPGFGSILPAAEMAVLRALELAGSRMLTRNNRHQFSSLARSELHTQMPVATTDDARQLMADAWTHVPTMARHYRINAEDLTELLSGYCAVLLTQGYAHSSELLEETLRRARGMRRA